jgi:GNAT superfamily N-acetyltransferase
MAERKLLDRRRNSFWKDREAAFWLVYDGRQPVARLAVFGALAGASRGDTAHFGFLETLPNFAALARLWAVALDWCRERGYTRLLGPFDPSLHHRSGVVIAGFDHRPYLMMPHQPAYYADFLARLGLHREMDFSAYHIPVAEDILHSRLGRVSEYLAGRHSIRVRPLQPHKRETELATLRRLYNAAFADHWGFHPIDEVGFRELVGDLVQLADPDLILIAEHAGKAIGFVLCVPNFNEAFAHLPQGKLLPFGWLKLWWYARRIRTVRVMTIGVLPAFRNLGTGPILMRRVTEAILAKGFRGGEISWVADNNTRMRQAALDMGGQPYRKIRIYGTQL